MDISVKSATHSGMGGRFIPDFPLEKGELKSEQGIFYEGQIYDAYKLITGIFKNAQKSIIVIDNYLDDSVLTMLEKKKKTVAVELYSQNIPDALKQAAEKFNKQYGNILLRQIKTVHDRFIIIDRAVIYHFGASLKDTGKKVFAFSKLNIDAEELLKKL